MKQRSLLIYLLFFIIFSFQKAYCSDKFVGNRAKQLHSLARQRQLKRELAEEQNQEKDAKNNQSLRGIEAKMLKDMPSRNNYLE